MGSLPLLVLFLVLVSAVSLSDGRHKRDTSCRSLFTGECGDSSSLGRSPTRSRRMLGNGVVREAGRWPWYVQVLIICARQFVVKMESGEIFKEWSESIRSTNAAPKANWRACGRCGGNLVSDNWVLTVGHCADHGLFCRQELCHEHWADEDELQDAIRARYSARGHSVRSVGIHPVYGHWLNAGSIMDRSGFDNRETRMVSNESAGEQSRISTEFYRHDDYQLEYGMGRQRGFNDIALIRVPEDEPFQLTEHVKPVCVPIDGSCSIPDTCYMAGNGDTKGNYYEDGERLREGEATHLSQDDCKKQLIKAHSNLYRKGIADDKICSRDYNERYGPCDGDSGGPFVCKDSARDGSWYLQGLIQDVYDSGDFGRFTCDPAGFATHTDVQHYTDWIVDTISEAQGNQDGLNLA